MSGGFDQVMALLAMTLRYPQAAPLGVIWTADCKIEHEPDPRSHKKEKQPALSRDW